MLGVTFAKSGLHISYDPNLSAPSRPYPTTVGVSPCRRKPAPSSAMILRTASATEPLYASGLVCIRVLTTSIGVV